MFHYIISNSIMTKNNNNKLKNNYISFLLKFLFKSTSCPLIVNENILRKANDLKQME